MLQPSAVIVAMLGLSLTNQNYAIKDISQDLGAPHTNKVFQ